MTNAATAIYLSAVVLTIPPDTMSSGGTVTSLCASVGVNEIATYNSFRVSPNPFTNELIVNSSGEAILYDVTGKEILRQKTSDGETKINTSFLTPGFYLLCVVSEKEKQVFKVIRN
ncbi:MAG: T9SS type A sorting domain-containing protein [Bacteroidota bacterium]